MNEASKDVEINGHRYRIGRLTAMTGTWIIAQLDGNMSQDGVFQKVQGYLLSVCQRYKTLPDGKEAPLPIFDPPDKWLEKDLEYDTLTVFDLCEEAIKFNLDPFFQAKKLLPGALELPDVREENERRVRESQEKR